MSDTLWPQALRRLVLALSLAAAGSAAGAAEPADPSRGRSLARANCAYCHVVTADQGFAPVLRPQGPDFAAIAANRKHTAATLRKFLLTTHQNFSNAGGMPNPLLSNDQVADVVSFILSQRKDPQ